MREVLEGTQRLLDIRTSELKAAEAFLQRPDRYAGTDITNMIETLNLEIQETASVMADVFTPELQPQDPGTTANDEGVGVHEAAVEHTAEILGDDMTKLLQRFNHL